MTDREMSVLQHIMELVPELPETQQYRVLGKVEGMAEIVKAQKGEKNAENAS